MGKVYGFIDRMWQWLAERVFIRFEFNLPLELLKQYQSERVILSLAHVGIIEFLILTSWCRQNGLPGIQVSNKKRILFLANPKLFLKILFRQQSYAELFLSEIPGPRLMFCPVNERKRLSEKEPVEALLSEIYGASPQPPFHFFPIFVLWRRHAVGASRKPSEYLLGLGSDPNLIGKLWYLVRQRKDSTVKSLADFSMLVDSSDAADADEKPATKLAKQTRRRIIVLIHQERRVVLGPRYSSPHAVVETLLREPEIKRVIDDLVREQGADRKKVMSIAYRNLIEIVSNYRYRTIELMYVFLSWFFNRVFDGVAAKKEDLHRVREEMRTKPVVFVSCHRSHFDYLVIPYVLFEKEMVTPHIAAGINLSFWPFGPLARSGGAFFIRRSFRGDLLYSTCLRKYVEYLLRHRYNIKFFIEGTRSRSGKMLPPAYGLLKMVLEAQKNNAVEDIAFVPVSITYEEVPEERSYTREAAGGQKTKESAKQLIKSIDVIRRNFGKVYVRFGEVLHAKDFAKELLELDSPQNLVLPKTAFQLCKNINTVTPVTAKAVIASVFLGHSSESLSLEEIHQQSAKMAQYVATSGHELSAGDMERFHRSVEQTVRRLCRAGVLQLESESVPRRYHCDRRRRPLFALYRNSSIHCFVTPAIALVAAFRALVRFDIHQKGQSLTETVVEEALSLRNLLKFDFFFSQRNEFVSEIEKCLNYFFGDAFRSLSVQEIWQKKVKSQFKEIHELQVFCRQIEDLLGSYLLIVQFCSANVGGIFERKTLLQKVLKFSEQIVAKDSAFLPETLSVQNFTNAVSLLENHRILKTEEQNGKKMLRIESNSTLAGELEWQLKDYLHSIQVEIVDHFKQHQSLTFQSV